jgi:di/tricarboxylate transporter
MRDSNDARAAYPWSHNSSLLPLLNRTTAGVASLLVLALIASIIMCCLGILSEQEARDSVNWDVYITVASAFGIGTALVNSGVAGSVADFLVKVGTSVGSGCECWFKLSKKIVAIFLLILFVFLIFQMLGFTVLCIWQHFLSAMLLPIMRPQRCCFRLPWVRLSRQERISF